MEATDQSIRKIGEMFNSAFASWQGRSDSQELREEIVSDVVKIMRKARVVKMLPMSFQPFEFRVFPNPKDRQNLIFDGTDEYTQDALKYVWFQINTVDDPNKYNNES